MPDFKLPDLGEGVTEAEIDRWLVTEGDEIAEDDPLVEVITDKATAEIPSPFAGKVSRIHVGEGQVVPVGTTLVTIGDGVAQSEVVIDSAPQKAAPVPAPDTAPALAPDEGRSSAGTAVKATPPVRKLARELGVDLAAVTGSGPGGRIVRADVEAHARGAAGSPASSGVEATRAPATTSAPTATAGRREPMRGVRRVIAERMTQSHQTIPAVTHVEECDVTELDATRKYLNERPGAPVRFTFLPFIVKAVALALQDYPALNASLDEQAGEIVFHDRYDIGVAVETPAGLVVPVVRQADAKGIVDIARDVERLASGAREGSLTADELRGGTFTITSPGPFGGLMATPIIFHPQSGILGVHRAVERPVVRDGQIVVRKIMNLSITFDHRILDGMTAAKFCVDVARSLEHPAALALGT